MAGMVKGYNEKLEREYGQKCETVKYRGKMTAPVGYRPGVGRAGGLLIVVTGEFHPEPVPTYIPHR